MAHITPFPFTKIIQVYGQDMIGDMRASDFYKAFGFKHTPGPAVVRQMTINGRNVWITSKTRDCMEMRVFTACPDCGKVMNPGKLRQHMSQMRIRENHSNPEMLRQPGETNKAHQERMDWDGDPMGDHHGRNE